ncbi:serine hydrolase domain-containing protein [Nonomuraea sp. NPDC046802]|uniref:serine hydrolase domain-containing protein n=1 Tax=Nonomuraea sp. NPDC046802 TaxID=3154919 RepID=UPI0033F315A7
MNIDALAEALDGLVPEIMDHCGTPGLSIAVGIGREVALTRAYGLADLATGRPMTTDTVGPTGSDAKPYTGVAAMQLVERGLIGLDDPVNDHLDGLRIDNPHGPRPITLRDLLTHHSGLGTSMGNWDRVPPPPLGDHLRRVFAAGRSDAYGGAVLPFWAGPVGAGYQYSNLGIAVVGLLVEQLNPDRVPFSEWVRRHVFAPLAMDSTCFPPAQHPDFVPAELLERRSVGYATLPGFRFPLPALYPGDYPAGSALTTPGDHARFILALLNGGRLGSGAVIRPDTAQQMITPQATGGDRLGQRAKTSVGLVFNVFDEHIGHGGEYLWGWSHFTRGWPGHGVALVISANQYDLGDFGLSERPSHLAARLVAETVTAWVRGLDPRPRHTPAAARGYLAGMLIGDRLTTRLGIPTPPSAEEIARIARTAIVDVPWDAEVFRQAVPQVRLPRDDTTATAFSGTATGPNDSPATASGRAATAVSPRDTAALRDKAAAVLGEGVAAVLRELPAHQLALVRRQLGVPGFGAMAGVDG